MNRIFIATLLAICCLFAATPFRAQTPAPPKPAESQKATPPPSSANPFPEDTSNIPVMPSKSTPDLADVTHNGAENAPVPLPGKDLDPVRSPDDPEPTAAVDTSNDDSSSSQAGLENLLPPPDDDQPGKKKKPGAKPQTQKEAASQDITVGSYYLDTKNWKGALSRYESALVLDPDNPDVYWGLAESNRHLGNLADARANYEKVAEYDPDSRHGKDARKALKEPEIANGKNPAPIPPSAP